MIEISRPSYAYVPGVSERHPEGYFDALKADVTTGMSEAEMQASLAWRAGLAYRADGFYWECHEVLEALWQVAPKGPLRSYIQAVIQMANAQLKVQMARPKAALRLCDIVCVHLDACGGRARILGQRVEDLRFQVLMLEKSLR